MPFLPSRWLSVLVFGAVLIVLPLILPNKFQLSVLILVGLSAIVCVGLNLLVGTAGQISLGHAGFFGIGAYASAILTGDLGWNGIAAMAVGVAASAGLGAVVGWPILRLRGHYLAMATLGVGVIVYLALVREIALTGGPDGRAVAPLTVFGARIHGEFIWYCIVAAVLWFCVWAAENLSSSPWGRSLRAIHGSEHAAAALGIDVHRLKVAVFAVSAGLASLAGSLYAHAFAFVTPDQSGFLHSVEFVVMIVVGGLGSVFGGVIGAAVIVVLPQLLTALKDFEHLVFGALLIAVVFAMHRGLVPTVAELWRRRA